MNIYKKYYPNVFVAQSESEHKKGDIITLTTKWGDEHECIVHNLVGKSAQYFYYSITRADGLTSQDRAKMKVEKLNSWATSADNRSDEYRNKSNEGKEFLSLGEPIKIGHHSEKRHRALIDRNWKNMSKCISERDKAEAYRNRTSYWEEMAKQINLSMPESLEFFEVQLQEAEEYHKGLKDGSIKREHSFSLTYSNKRVKDLKEKCKHAKILWA